MFSRIPSAALARPLNPSDPLPALSPRSELGRAIERLSPTGSGVLLIGPPGRGRRWAARALHAHAGVPGRLMRLEIAPPHSGEGASLVEVLGHLRHDSLYVRSLVELPVSWQATLAEHVAEIGSPRVLASVDGDPEPLVRSGHLRRDLLDSLLPLPIPPLRDRIDDLDAVLPQLLRLSASRAGVEAPGISDIARARLRAYDWPGDQAELEQFADRAVALGSLEAAICAQSSAPRPDSWQGACASLRQGRPVKLDSVCRHVIRQVEREWIDRVVRGVDGDLVAAAGRLGLGTRTLTAKLRDLGLEGRA